jgi:hypothetical protein
VEPIVATLKVGEIAESATALLALLALLGTVRQLRQTRAHEYLRRFDEPGLLPYIEKTHAVIHMSGIPVATRIDRWEQMPFRERLDALLYLNFWEEMAGMYNRRLLNRRIISDYFGDAALDYWALSEWLALHMRNTDNGHVYRELEKMCRHIRRRRRWRKLLSNVLRFRWLSSAAGPTPTPAPTPPQTLSGRGAGPPPDLPPNDQPTKGPTPTPAPTPPQSSSLGKPPPPS